MDSQIFETADARNSVKHILSGKAGDCAVHAHNLLSTVVQRKIYKMALSDADMMKNATNMFKGLMEHGPGNFDAAFVDSITRKLMILHDKLNFLQYLYILIE